MSDSIAWDAMLDHARRRGLGRIGLLLPNTSTAAAARRLGVAIVAERWFNRGTTSLAAECAALHAEGSQAIGLVTNETEGALLLREPALPTSTRACWSHSRLSVDRTESWRMCS